MPLESLVHLFHKNVKTLLSCYRYLKQFFCRYFLTTGLFTVAVAAVAVQAVLVLPVALAVWLLPVQAAPDLVEQLPRQLTLPLSFCPRHAVELFQIFSRTR